MVSFSNHLSIMVLTILNKVYLVKKGFRIFSEGIWPHFWWASIWVGWGWLPGQCIPSNKGTLLRYLQDLFVNAEQVNEDITALDNSGIQYWMSQFWKDGLEYPPSTLHHICCEILHHLFSRLGGTICFTRIICESMDWWMIEIYSMTEHVFLKRVGFLSVRWWTLWRGGQYI